MTAAVHVITSPAINLTGWTYLAGPDPKGVITPHPADVLLGNIFTPILAAEFEKEPPEVSLPFEWHGSGSDGADGEEVTDPLTIDIELPLSSEQTNGPIWRVSVGALIDDLIRDMDNLGVFSASPPTLEEEDVAMLGRIVSALRDEADRLEHIIAHGPPPELKGPVDDTPRYVPQNNRST